MESKNQPKIEIISTESEYDEEAESDDEDEWMRANNQPYPHHTFMTDKQKQTVSQWLTSKNHFTALRDNLGADFADKGARFVPICGDGNCFFSAVSVSITACKEKPFGTKTMHDELRQKVCDYI